MATSETGKGAVEAIQSTIDFFGGLAKEIDSILIDSVAKTYQSVAQTILPIALGFVVLWVSYFGLMMIMRPQQAGSISDFMWKLIKIVAIMAIAFSWSNVYEFIANPFLNGSNELVAKAAGANAETLLLENVAKIFENIQNAIDTFSSSSGFDIGASLTVALITFANFIAAAGQIASYFYFVIDAKLTIAILLILAPVFLSFLMFESTRNYFTNWISALLHPVLTLLIMAIVMAFMGFVTQKALGDTLGVNISSAFLALIISLFTIGFIWKAPRIASNLVSNGFGLNDGNGKFKPLQQAKDWNSNRKSRAMQKDNYRQYKANKAGK